MKILVNALLFCFLSISSNAGVCLSLLDKSVVGSDLEMNLEFNDPIYSEILNSGYYNSLVQTVGFVIKENKKGLIVVSSIDDAKKLYYLFSKAFEDTDFQIYHKDLTFLKKENIMLLSASSNRHFIIAVESIDEDFNLEHLTTYIDLNKSISVDDMIERLSLLIDVVQNKFNHRTYTGYHLRSAAGYLNPFSRKEESSFLFLADYVDVELAKYVYKILIAIEKIHAGDRSYLGSSKHQEILVKTVKVFKKGKNVTHAKYILAHLIKNYFHRSVLGFSKKESDIFFKANEIKTQTEFSEWLETGELSKGFLRPESSKYELDFLNAPDFDTVDMTYGEAVDYIKSTGVSSKARFYPWGRTYIKY